ncbi:MAG: hypothetical protein ACFE9Q_05050 [Candidatus Hodarchaeota archaeon]
MNVGQFISNFNNPYNDLDSPTEYELFNELKTSDYSSSYSGTGESMNITLHQSYLNNSFNTLLNASDVNNNTFTLPSPKYPTFNSSFVNVTINDIYAPDKALDVEPGPLTNWLLETSICYTSFEVPSSCYLKAVDVNIRSTAAGRIFTYDVYSAKYTSGYIRPNADLTGGLAYLGQIGNDSTTDVWLKLTGLNQLLNASSAETYNNTFFIRLTSSDVSTYWNIDSVGNSYETISYRNPLETSEPESYDFSLKVDLAPLSNTPKPKQIGLEINDIVVENVADGKGYWNPSDELNDSDGNLDFTVTADWWDVSFNVAKVQINYTRTDLRASSKFIISGDAQPVEWNVTRNGGLNYFDSRLGYKQINFTIPDTWDEHSIRVFNGSTPKTSDSTNHSLGNGYREVNILGAGNGTLWYLTAESTNLLPSMTAYTETSTPSKFNYTNIVHLNATFSTYVDDGLINLTVYSPVEINNFLNYTLTNDSFYAGDEIYFGDWNISKTVIKYGVFRIKLGWNNYTDAGFLEDTIEVVADTSLKILYPSPNVIYNANKVFNITVFYNDTGQNQIIADADIQYKINNEDYSPINESVEYITNGQYNITFDCNNSKFNYGQNNITISAGGNYYNNQTETFYFKILGVTDLFNTTTVKSSYNSTETFVISLFFNDTIKDLGIPGATREVFINQTLHSPVSNIDQGLGNYDITINCSDDDFATEGYGYFNLTIDVKKTYYHNQSISFIIYITGETSLSATKFPDPIIGYYNSDDIFNITISFKDIGRNDEGIDEGLAKIYVKEVSASSYQAYTPIIIDPYSGGFYNITVNCSDPIFYPYAKYNIKINITKTHYYTASTVLEEIVVGNTTLTIHTPEQLTSYVENEIFDILIEYMDHTRSIGINESIISYSISGMGFRQDNVTDNNDGTYNITIYANHADFDDNYGFVDIIIRANKTNYINLTRTFTFERQILTQITPFNNPPLIEVKGGLNVTYTFNYSDRKGNPIVEYDTFGPATLPFGFDYYIWNDGNGNYTLDVITSSVTVRVDPYILNFSISAFGNQSQKITLTILLTIIQTRIDNISWNDDADFARTTWTNVSVNFYFNDTTNNNPIVGLNETNVNIKDYYVGTKWLPGFDLFTEPGPGNYKLNISIAGKNSGLYTLQLNVSKYPDYNWSLAYIQFYLRGNHSQINMISVEDPEEILIPTGIGNNYTTFLGSDLTIEFNITDTEWNNNIVTLVPSDYIITFKQINTGMTGTLQESLGFIPLAPYTHSGSIVTSALTDTGFYIINVTVIMLNYENTTFSFNLTLINSRINIILISNQGGQLEPSGVGNYYNSTIALDLNLEFNITDTESLNKTIARDASLYLVRYINLGTGDNGTILNSLTFNSPTSKYIGTITTSGLGVGNYLINVSVVILNYKIIPLTFNLTIVYANSNIISITNPGGQLEPSIIDNFYETFIGSNIGIEFNTSDVHFGTIIQIGTGVSYSIFYQNIDTLASGYVMHTISESISLHSGNLNISLLSIGNYSFTVMALKNGNNVTSVDLLLRIIDKYETRITVVNPPESVNAGLPFSLIIRAEFFDGSVWLPIDGSSINITLYYNNGVGESEDYYTNSTGEIKVIIPTYSDTLTLNITVQLNSAYYHKGRTAKISDIDIIPIPAGFLFEDILPYLIIAGIAAAAIGGSVAIYRGIVVPKKREKLRILTEVKTIFDDAINLEHILVLYKGTGTCIYFKSFGSEEIDPELISGFISAISSFGKDLVSQEELNEISYGDKMLLLSDGENIRVALVLGKKASLILRRNLMEFIHVFEKIYANELPNWRGQLNIFRDSGTLVDDILNTSIILPHEITYEITSTKTLKKSQSREVLKIANSLMKDSERNFFFIATLLKEATEKAGKETAEIFMGIKELRDKKILIPIEITSIEAPPISQQELNLINQKVSELVDLSPEERKKLVNDLAQIGPAEREAYFVSLSEQQEIVSAPIESKAGAAVIDNIKGAKKEIKNLKKNALSAKKNKDYDTSIKILHNAIKIATNWELTSDAQILDDLIRMTKIEDLNIKLKKLEKEAKLAAKDKNYNEAAQKYKISSKIASEIFKLGVNEMTKEVKRLTNKAKEFEKLI